MNIFKLKQNTILSALTVLILAAILLGIAPTSNVYGAGEVYRQISPTEMVVTGGELAGNTTLTKSDGSGFFGGEVTHAASGCVFTLTVTTFEELANDGDTGDASINSSADGDGGNFDACTGGVDILSLYNSAANGSLTSYTLSFDPAEAAADAAAAAATSEGGVKFEGTCANSSIIGYVICSVIDWMVYAIDFFYNTFVLKELVVNPLDSSATAGTPEAYLYEAWNNFRIVANILFIFVFFLATIGQIFSFALTPYELKRIIPRLAIGAIAIQLSWFMMGFMIDLFNVLGGGIRALILAPIDNIGVAFDWTSISIPLIVGGGGKLALALGASGGLNLTMGMILVPILLAVIATIIIIIIRKIAIFVLILLAPLALVAWILPGTDGFFKQWWSFFWKALAMYPIIIALIASGKLLATISTAGTLPDGVEEIVGMVALFAPYFLIPASIRFAGGVVANVAGGFQGMQKRASEAYAGDIRNRFSRRSQRRSAVRTQRQQNLGRFASRNAGGFTKASAAQGKRAAALSRSRNPLRRGQGWALRNAKIKGVGWSSGRAAIGVGVAKGINQFGPRAMPEYIAGVAKDQSERAEALISNDGGYMLALLGLDSMIFAENNAPNSSTGRWESTTPEDQRSMLPDKFRDGIKDDLYGSIGATQTALTTGIRTASDGGHVQILRQAMADMVDRGELSYEDADLIWGNVGVELAGSHGHIKMMKWQDGTMVTDQGKITEWLDKYQDKEGFRNTLQYQPPEFWQTYTALQAQAKDTDNGPLRVSTRDPITGAAARDANNNLILDDNKDRGRVNLEKMHDHIGSTLLNNATSSGGRSKLQDVAGIGAVSKEEARSAMTGGTIIDRYTQAEIDVLDQQALAAGRLDKYGSVKIGDKKTQPKQGGGQEYITREPTDDERRAILTAIYDSGVVNGQNAGATRAMVENHAAGLVASNGEALFGSDWQAPGTLNRNSMP